MTLLKRTFFQSDWLPQATSVLFQARGFTAINFIKEIRQAWIDGRNVFICSNGGSAANIFMQMISTMELGPVDLALIYQGYVKLFS